MGAFIFYIDIIRSLGVFSFKDGEMIFEICRAKDIVTQTQVQANYTSGSVSSSIGIDSSKGRQISRQFWNYRLGSYSDNLLDTYQLQEMTRWRFVINQTLQYTRSSNKLTGPVADKLEFYGPVRLFLPIRTFTISCKSRLLETYPNITTDIDKKNFNRDFQEKRWTESKRTIKSRTTKLM